MALCTPNEQALCDRWFRLLDGQPVGGTPSWTVSVTGVATAEAEVCVQLTPTHAPDVDILLFAPADATASEILRQLRGVHLGPGAPQPWVIRIDSDAAGASGAGVGSTRRRGRSRAGRVSVRVPVAYRRGDGAWLHARTINMSASGVLFAPAGVECGDLIEVVFSLPRLMGSLPKGRQVCVAEVVRATAAGAVAAHFDECRFLLDAFE